MGETRRCDDVNEVFEISLAPSHFHATVHYCKPKRHKKELNTQPYFLVGLKPRGSPKGKPLAGDKNIGTHSLKTPVLKPNQV